MIRHTSVDVEPGICYGQSDVPLKPSFPDEAAEVRKNLSGCSFDAVYTSPLTRCVRLAEFCGYPDAVRDDRLKELNFGDWEMQRFDEISDPRLQLWYDDYYNVRPTGGESFHDQRLRLENFLSELKSKGLNSVAIFAHGGILLQAMLITNRITLSEAFSHQPPYGGIIEIDL